VVPRLPSTTTTASAHLCNARRQSAPRLGLRVPAASAARLREACAMPAPPVPRLRVDTPVDCPSLASESEEEKEARRSAQRRGAPPVLADSSSEGSELSELVSDGDSSDSVEEVSYSAPPPILCAPPQPRARRRAPRARRRAPGLGGGRLVRGVRLGPRAAFHAHTHTHALPAPSVSASEDSEGNPIPRRNKGASGAKSSKGGSKSKVQAKAKPGTLFSRAARAAAARARLGAVRFRLGARRGSVRWQAHPPCPAASHAPARPAGGPQPDREAGGRAAAHRPEGA